MTARSFTESIVEDAALAWLEALGYAVLHGPDIATDMLGADRSESNCCDVVLEGRLRCQALVRLNPDPPPAGLRETLLPELISGELRVKDAERMVEIA
jgi:type I restriction enzyme R subunit